MIRLLIFIFSACIVFEGLSQDEEREIDSLKKIITTQHDDSTKVNTLIDLGMVYLSTDLQEAIRYGNEALTLAKKINHPLGLALSHKLLGLAYADLGNYPEANIHFNATLDAFEAIGNKDGIANALSNLGSLSFSLGEDAKAIELQLRSLKIAEEINNKLRIGTNLTNIGTVYSNKEATTDKAITYFRRALTIFEEINYTDGIGVASVNIGEIYFNKKMYDSALIFLNTSIKMYEGTADAAYALSYVGEIYAELNDFENALNYHNAAIEVTERVGAKLSLAQSLLSLAKTIEKKGDLIKSIEAYKKAQTISEGIGARQEVKKAYEALAQLYATLGDFKNAYSYESLLTSIKDTLYNTDEDKKIQQLQFNFDINKKEAEISLQQATIERQEIVNWAAGITGFLLLIMVAGIFSRYKYIKQTNKIIKNERDRSQELLLNILPEETARELEVNGHAKTQYYESVTVLFTDFKGFSTIAGKLTPIQLVAQLNIYFMAFDEIMEMYNLEKIKTIGDAYMCAGGIPLTNSSHPLDAVKAALAMQAYMEKRQRELKTTGLEAWELRIGIHTGPVVAGVVGKKKYAYDIWGDTVNVASRMESNGAPGKVNISSATFNLIKDKYECNHRGKISAKNIGEVDMYFIEKEITAQPVEAD